jgi:hypothetical protein
VATEMQQLGSLCIVDMGVAVNNKTLFSVATEMQQLDSLCIVVELLLSTLKLI